MAHVVNMVRGLLTWLLVLATLVAFAGPGWAKAFAPTDVVRPFQGTLVAPASLDGCGPAVDAVLTTADATKRPCDSRGASPGTARCPTAIPCLTVCGALPNAASTVPPPSAAGADSHARAIDDPSRGITTLPDLPPPRLSA